MNAISRSALAVAGLALAAQAAASVTFYEREGFDGRSFMTSKPVANFERFGFNDRASSAVVTGERWEACEDARFAGRCVVLRPGQYGSLAAMGLNNRVSSVRIVERNARIDDSRFAPPPVVERDYRRRRNERLYEAEVTSARAVVGPAGERCWIEREQVEGRGETNVAGAIAGAVIGGILGHQVGGGRGQDLATAGGAIAGAALGANIGRDQQARGYSRDVEHCSGTRGRGRPEYWDVTYTFRGQEHHVQMAVPPGRTITVNGKGEPRAAS